MSLSKLARALMGSSLALPGVASALVVEIQGVRLEPESVGASCVNIIGEYPGVRIEADEPGHTPRICHTAARVNSISISNATLVATPPIRKDIVLTFEHEFPPGINGKIMARARLRGFFATDNGIGVPTGDRLSLSAFFSQGATKDLIAEPLKFTVGETLESGLFDYSVKEEYLAAGPRALKGEIKVMFNRLGHKVTFPEKCLISLDSGSKFEDKLETIEPLDEEGAPASGNEIPGSTAPGAGPAEEGPLQVPEVPLERRLTPFPDSPHPTPDPAKP